MSETILAYRAERTPDPVVEPDRVPPDTTEPYRDVTEKSCYTCGHYPLNKNVAAGCSKRKEDEITCMDSPARPFWKSRITEEQQSGGDDCRYDTKSRYYDAGGIEVLEIIRAKLTPEQFRGFCLGNAIKYTCRANFKDDYVRDMEKAGFYVREAR
jgi:hypothetical protein